VENSEFFGANVVPGSEVISITSTDTEQFTPEGTEEKPEVKPSGTEETPKEGQEDPAKKEETPELTPEEKLQADVQKSMQADADVQKDLEGKGVDFTSLATEYESSGTLSAESFAALEAAGYPRSVVDAYITGMEATANQFTQAVYGFAGGEQEFVKIAQFVQGLGESQVKTFNKIVETGDLNQIQVVVEGYRAKMTAKYGTANPSLIGGGQKPQAVQGFSNKAEMVQAMSDPKYGKDKAYTTEVKTKVSASRFL
jgi:hypothetical protein